MFVALVERAGLAPLLANVMAFIVAVVVSFHGHFHWTFRGAVQIGGPERRTALARFFLVALIGLALNSLAIWWVVDQLALPYAYALILMVGVVPPVLFALNGLWVFA